MASLWHVASAEDDTVTYEELLARVQQSEALVIDEANGRSVWVHDLYDDQEWELQPQPDLRSLIRANSLAPYLDIDRTVALLEKIIEPEWLIGLAGIELLYEPTDWTGLDDRVPNHTWTPGRPLLGMYVGSDATILVDVRQCLVEAQGLAFGDWEVTRWFNIAFWTTLLHEVYHHYFAHPLFSPDHTHLSEEGAAEAYGIETFEAQVEHAPGGYLVLSEHELPSSLKTSA